MTDMLSAFQKDILPHLVDEIGAEQILLFGSVAKGTAKEDSDLDIIIVADLFESMSFLERMPYLLKRYPFKWHIDYLCYSPSEFKRISTISSIVRDALDNGIFLVS